jgi:transcriptional regulator with XRE-family HTH domain
MAFTSVPYSAWPLEAVLEAISAEARVSARRRLSRRRKNVGGATIRPGADTPLWNKLVADVRVFLKVRGEQAQLARLLGVQRQAVNEYFITRRRMPDAERVLLLQEWLRLRQSGKRPSW